MCVCSGGYGNATRGLYRVHQFSKVELFAWTSVETGRESEEMLQEMVDIQMEISKELGLHYRYEGEGAGVDLERGPRGNGPPKVYNLA